MGDIGYFEMGAKWRSVALSQTDIGVESESVMRGERPAIRRPWGEEHQVSARDISLLHFLG